MYKSLYDEDENLDNDIGSNLLYEIYSHLDYEEMSKYFSIDQYNRTLPTTLGSLFFIMHMNTRSILKKLDS